MFGCWYWEECGAVCEVRPGILHIGQLVPASSYSLIAGSSSHGWAPRGAPEEAQQELGMVWVAQISTCSFAWAITWKMHSLATLLTVLFVQLNYFLAFSEISWHLIICQIRITNPIRFCFPSMTITQRQGTMVSALSKWDDNTPSLSHFTEDIINML